MRYQDVPQIPPLNYGVIETPPYWGYWESH